MVQFCCLMTFLLQKLNVKSDWKQQNGLRSCIELIQVIKPQNKLPTHLFVILISFNPYACVYTHALLFHCIYILCCEFTNKMHMSHVTSFRATHNKFITTAVQIGRVKCRRKPWVPQKMRALLWKIFTSSLALKNFKFKFKSVVFT